MAVLKRTRGAAVRVGLPVLMATFLGCALIEDLRGVRDGIAFSHRLHVVDQELECVMCHEDAMMEDDPGLPSYDTCALCHDTIDEEKSEERRIGQLFEDGVYVAKHAAALADEVVFSHVLHAGGDQECGDCHAGIEENERVDRALGVAMAACMACHEARETPNECATCHTEIRADVAPPNHDHHWTRRHGQESRAHPDKPSSSCYLCHTESSCADCHLVEEPESHTNTFRVRTHGFFARTDRDKCAACHQPDSCEACHADARPQSHTGQWGSVRNRHCLGCHFPLKAEGCVVCHKGTPSHSLAAPKPSWHTPAMNCRMCHGLSQPLPHVDKGDDCNACHL